MTNDMTSVNAAGLNNRRQTFKQVMEETAQ